MQKPPKKRKKSHPPDHAAESAHAAERVQKILARAGLASRREAEEWIRAGRVSINGSIVTLGTRAQGSDQIRLDGRLVRQAPTRESATFLCHRSPGEPLLKAEPGSDQSPLAERLPRRVGRRYLAVSPMPRIDGGLELLTSDGELAARLQRAVRRLRVDFSLRVRGELSQQQVDGLMEGLIDSGEKLQLLRCEPAGGEGANRWYSIETRGANGRELRSLVERQGATVSRMMRTALGGLALDRSLPRGHTRALEDQDLTQLLADASGAAATSADAPGDDEPGEA